MDCPGSGRVELGRTPSKPITPGTTVPVEEEAVNAIVNDGDEPLEVLAVLVLDRDRPPFVPVEGG